MAGSMSLEAYLERKVLSLLKRYQAGVQAGTQQQARPAGRSSRTPAATAAGLDPLWDVEAMLAYIQQQDPALRRKQDRMLLRAIDACLTTLRAASLRASEGDGDLDDLDDEVEQPTEEEENDQGTPEEDSDDGLGEVVDDGSMVLEPRLRPNHMNRSLLGMYAQQQQHATPRSTTTPLGSNPIMLPAVGAGMPTVPIALPVAVPLPLLPSVAGQKRAAKAASIDSATSNHANTAGTTDATTPRPASKKESKRLKAEEKERKQLDKWAPPTARLSDLGGIDGCIEEILQLIAMPLQHPEIYQHLGIQPPRGILLHGPPGTGKTFLAHAIAGEIQVPFLNVSAPSIVSGMSGESEKKLREVFEEAKALAPCLLFLDEIDAITPKRENAQREMERRIVAQLLTCMDDLSLERTGGKPVIIIGATNRPDALDPALRRAGRFDREIAMSVPDQQARTRILERLCAKLRLDANLNVENIARLTPGFVGADLKALASEAGIVAVKRIFHALMASGSSGGREEAERDDALLLPAAASPGANGSASRPMEGDGMQDPDPMTCGDMELDGTQQLLTNQISVSEFLAGRPKALSASELAGLFISTQDFLEALRKVQPSAKREGFATVPNVTWEDVGALQSVRDELRLAIVEPVRHPEYFERVGITAPMGVLLYGPPGCGKTMLAKAVANESLCNFISVKGPELLNKYVGESERAVRTVFARAQSSAPCVIFFDELDALCPSRSNDAESQSSSRLVNTLLTEMDGMQGRRQVYVIAATNRPDMIDQAMLRPGRLDKTLYVDLPNAAERYEILKTLTRRTPLAAGTDLRALAHHPKCEGLSGADLAALVREASVLALKSYLDFGAARVDVQGLDIQVTVDHFVAVFDKLTPSVSKRDRKRYEHLRLKFGSASISGSAEDGEEVEERSLGSAAPPRNPSCGK